MSAPTTAPRVGWLYNGDHVVLSAALIVELQAMISTEEPDLNAIRRIVLDEIGQPDQQQRRAG